MKLSVTVLLTTLMCINPVPLYFILAALYHISSENMIPFHSVPTYFCPGA